MWHRAPLTLRPAEVIVRPEQARNSACWESERVHYNAAVILEDAIIIILTLERNAKSMEAVTHLYEWDGRNV